MPPRFAQTDLDAAVETTKSFAHSDAHAAAASANYEATHWSNFAGSDQQLAGGTPSAYRPAQRAAVLAAMQSEATQAVTDQSATQHAVRRSTSAKSLLSLDADLAELEQLSS
jgi:hypothetical protein